MAEVVYDHVTKRFGETTALKDFNLKVEDKEFLVLVGPSGCGKSTALRMLAGLEDITEGDIYIGGRLVNNIPPKDRDIAMVFQSYALYPNMSVYDNMAFGLSLRKVPKVDIKRRVNDAARVLGIESLLQRKPRQLSGGQRQRVALGRAIVREPAAFLLDEPLSNLDAKLRVQTRAELSKLHQRLGTTFIYVTHDQVEAMTMADRIAVLDQGLLQQVGSPQELYNNPVNMFVAGFIGSPAMNFIEVKVIQDSSDLYFADGDFRLPVPEDKKKDFSALVNRRVVFGIRPEDIHPLDYLPAGLLGNAVVKARVEVMELMGNEIFIYLAAGGWSFLARVDPRTRTKVGEQIELALNMQNMHVFDIDSHQAVLNQQFARKGE